MLEKYKKGGTGSVLVVLDAIHNASTGVLGLDGKELVSDTTFDQQRRAMTCGKVIQLPVAMGSMPIDFRAPGFPGYGPLRTPNTGEPDDAHPALYAIDKISQAKLMSDIEPEVQIDDVIYFSWMATHNARNMIAKSQSKDGGTKYIFRIPYDQIYCAVRDGKIIMIGSYVLIDPVFESWDEILRATYYPFMGRDGRPKKRPKKEWLQIKVAPEQKDRMGIVAAVGSPLRGDKCYLEAGMKILYKPRLKSMKEIEGKKCFILRQNQIHCEVTEDE